MITLLILGLVGCIVGGMNAIAGGGMLIGFPVMVAFGIPPLIANATGNLVSLPGQLTSAIGYRKYLKTVSPLYLLLLIPIIIGSVAGALLLRQTPSDHFSEMVPILVLFAVALFAFQPLLHFHLHRHLHSRVQQFLPLALIGLAMIPVSIYGGYFGAGYGFIMLAFLGLASITDIHRMNAMKNIAAIAVSLSALACLFSANIIDWKAGTAMAIGTGIGGYAGSLLSQKFSTHAVRLFIIFIGLSATAFLAVRAY